MLGHRSPKMLFGEASHLIAPRQVHSFAAKLSRERHDNTNFHRICPPTAGHSNFSKKLGIPAPQNQDPSLPWSLRIPGKHRSIVVRQGERLRPQQIFYKIKTNYPCSPEVNGSSTPKEPSSNKMIFEISDLFRY
jgi:hypothetical protein